MKSGGFFYLVKIMMILAIAGAGFFCAQRAWAVEQMVISEAQIGGAMANDEFIELYNPTGQDINLAGFSLKKKTQTGVESNLISSAKFSGAIPAYGFFLIAHPSYKTAINADLAYSGASYYISAGNTILLYDASGNLLDKVGYGEASDFEAQAAGEPDSGKSIARKISANIMQDTDNNYADFEIKDMPNPQNSGRVVTPPPAEPPVMPPPDETATSTSIAENLSNPPASPASGLYQGGVNANLGEVVINELVSDPADGEVEWLELYNRSNREINLSGWKLEDGSKAKTSLAGNLGPSGSASYKVIEKPNGNLNNDGDLITLYDAGGKIIDRLAYGKWHDGNLEDNAPAAHDPAGLARKFDGYNTFNNANDFAITVRLTKRAANIIQTEDEVSQEARAGYDFSGDIFISEILPNPDGDDAKLEFIELFNAGSRAVNLTGWSLSNEDGQKKNLENLATSSLIMAGEYLAFYRVKTKIVLHNDQGEVRLFEPLADKPAQTVKYKDVKEGWSYNNENNLPNPLYQGGVNWVWSETVTPGAANIIKAVNRAPRAEFSWSKEPLVGRPVLFDSSDTDDPDGDSLKYTWDFGDGFKNSLANPEHTFFKQGIYQVRLEVSDGQATSAKEKSVKVANSVGELGGDEILVREKPPLTPLLKGGESGVIINEIFPNPAGADTGQEWLELKNQGSARVNLINWRVENSNGKYKFKDDLWLAAANFYLLTNAVSKLAFKNSSDIVSLYNNLDELADTVEYADAVQGEGYARGQNGKWFWTTEITPGEENVISLSDSQSVVLAVASGTAINADSYIETTLDKVRDLEIGSLIKVSGTVAVEPGILGVQIFYIATSSSGLQIYNYKKDFPSLKVGDYVEINGELAQAQDEFRIKTKTKNNIKIIEHRLAPMALALSCDALSEENAGQLITITGEITDKKASTAYVDDGSGEILVYFKQSAGLETKSLKAGQAAAITGILSKTATGLRLLPRYQEDIIKIDRAAVEPQVLGESIAAGEWAVAERDKKIELFKYLLIIAGGIITVLAGLFFRVKRKNAA